ncbi:MAG: alpha/beta fold hydrolase [Gordonia sp. (in: high G+C Gram-positive bacteria)]|uniref:alpha/beta fold hydrolase n=1 Tax=Gordonia sp. (in: high G+C Gram-positive bacteria) TaxID=84139 RepID=UPI003BB784C9
MVDAPTTAPTPQVRIEYRTVHGYRRAFRIAGEGPALLLIHGIGDNSSTWEGVISELARDYTVIAPDLLGHGLSDKPKADYSVAAFANGMRDLLVVLGITKVTVVGHSLGGGVAMQFCYQFPRFVQRLVLVAPGGVTAEVNPALRAVAIPGVPFVLQGLGLPGALPLLRSVGRLLARTDALPGIPERFAPRNVITDHQDLLRILGDLSDEEAGRSFTRTLRSVIDWRGQTVTFLDRAYLTERLPLLLIWGTADNVLPAHHAQLASAMIPHAEVVMFDGAGHFPFRDDPERFLALVRDFLARTEPMEFDPVNWHDMMVRGQQLDELEVGVDAAVFEDVREALEEERAVS